MAFTVTNNFTGDSTLTASELDANFTDIENKLNANLTWENLAATAGITNSQLAYSRFEIVLSHTIFGTATANEGLNATTSANFVVGSLPYDDDGGEAEYTILGIEHMTLLGTGAPASEMIMTLNYGNPTDGWTAILAGIGTDTTNSETREVGFTASVSASSVRPKFFVLDVTTQSSVAPNNFDDGDSWCISIKLKRTNGLRG